ncbi:MAG: 5-(carboxyamino)imidazole ribonucleotide synthase [Bacteroidetes bacterium]|nr:MAG: 5-(carboxyamino)imidazole ribonucleotide synthase [Bacteroidota bacterium]
MSITIGIIGGGQLGRMFIQNALNYPYQIHVLDADAHAPCATIAHRFTVGKLTDYEAVYQFGRQADVITIEIENVNVEALEQLEREGKRVFPQPHIIRLIQDKREQKKFLQTIGVPTADFVLIDSPADLEKHISFLPAFLKVGKGGYDGKGVQRIGSPADFGKAFAEPSLLEKAVENMRTEVAVMVARNAQREVVVYPPVEMAFDATLNLVDYLLSPYLLEAEAQQRVEAIAHKIVEELDFVGLLAIELFITTAGEILVNELAPRPHNSGHQTIEGNVCSQFDQHLRAILNLPLGDTASRGFSLMYNLIGEQGYEGEAYYEGLDKVLAMQGAYLHLYGKRITKAGRKMGHITLLGNTPEELKNKLTFIKQNFRVISES